MGVYKLGAKAYKEQWYQKNKERVKRYSKNRKYLNRYGITFEEAELLKAKGCEICGEQNKKLCIDHCHTTGKLRGCLCHGCNLLLGRIKEDVHLLEKAKLYILTRCQL